MRTRLFDLIGLLAVAAMLTSLWLLVRENEAGFGELELEISQQELEEGFREGYEYHAIYAGSQKVGTLRTERRRNGDGYRLRSEMDLRIDVLGTAQETFTSVDAFLDESFRLERFEASATGGPIELSLEGQWSGDRMVVTGLPGTQGARGFEMPEPPFILPSLRPVLMRSSLEVGDRVTFSYFDPLGQQEITADVTYLGQEEIELMGTTVEAFHFREVALGHQTHVWVNALGEVLIEEMPMGFRAVREPEAEARYGVAEGAAAARGEMSEGSSIALEEIGGDVLGRGRWDEGRFVFSDLRAEVADDLVDDAQSIEVDPEVGVTVRVSRSDELPESAPFDESERTAMRPLLGDSFRLETSDPAVVRAVGRALGRGERDELPSEIVVVLADWVRREVELVAAPDGIESASEVLERGSGSARGRAVALTALLRAAGVPARVAHGAVAVRADDGSTEVRRHTWVEAWLRTWVGVDPNLDMVPVDGGYLRFGYGSGDVQELLTRRTLSQLDLLRVEGTSTRDDE